MICPRRIISTFQFNRLVSTAKKSNNTLFGYVKLRYSVTLPTEFASQYNARKNGMVDIHF